MQLTAVYLPAPAGYVPPGKTEPEPPPPSPLKWHIAADGRAPVAFHVPPGLPTVGWGAGAQVTRALIDLNRIRFGAGFDFGYARFSSQFIVPQPDTSQHLAHMTFAAIAVFDAIVGIVRPWFTAGVGLSAAWYYEPSKLGGELHPDQELVCLTQPQLALGVASPEEPGTLIGCVASHLDHPFGSGMPGQAREADAARFQMDEEQDVVGGETSPGEHFHGEEVGTCQYGHVGSNKILPGGLLAALGCRRDPISAKDVSHRLIGNGMAEIGQSSDNAVVSPTGVLSGEADNQRLQCGRHWWPT